MKKIYTQKNIYLNSRINMEILRRSLQLCTDYTCTRLTAVSSCEKNAQKKIRFLQCLGFKPETSAILVQHSYHLR